MRLPLPPGRSHQQEPTCSHVSGAALGALSGELHGGANIQVMKMLLEIGDLDKVETWVTSRLQHGGRINGYGSRSLQNYRPKSRHTIKAVKSNVEGKRYEMV